MTTATESPRLSGQAITDELELAWQAYDHHGRSCSCCDRDAEPDELRTQLMRAAFYASDRYRPSDSYWKGATEAEIDSLAHDAAEAALLAARRAITAAVVERLAGKLTGEKR